MRCALVCVLRPPLWVQGSPGRGWGLGPLRLGEDASGRHRDPLCPELEWCEKRQLNPPGPFVPPGLKTSCGRR